VQIRVQGDANQISNKSKGLGATKVVARHRYDGFIITLMATGNVR